MSISSNGHLFPRRTEIRLEPFAKIDKSVAALSNIRVGWDKKNCYIGTSVKSDDYVQCNEFDHLLCVERSGDFKVIDIPDKIFIDRLFEFRRYDKNTMFGVVYSEKKTGRAFFKRTRIASFIKDRDYRIAPEGCRLELITPRPNAIYEIKVDTPIKAKQVQQISLMDAPERSPKAGGILISPRKLLKITFVRLLDESDSAPEPELVEVPPDDDGGNNGGNGGGNGGGSGSVPEAETKPAPANSPEPQSAPVRNEAPVQPKPVVPETQVVKPRVRLKNDAKASAAPSSSVEPKKAPETKPVAKPVSPAKSAPLPVAPAAKPENKAEPAPQPAAKPAPQPAAPAPIPAPQPAAPAEPEKTPDAPAPEDKTDSAKRSVETEREEDSWDVQPDLGF